jgi:hypothetical protein
MKQSVLFKLLMAANLGLVGLLLFGLNRANPIGGTAGSSTAEPRYASPAKSEPGQGTAEEGTAKDTPGHSAALETPFAKVYSPDPKQFAANLRAIRCPEQTVIDILTAETHREFRAQEEALRPTPADHVPFGWSARTTEPKLLERRQEAAALTREKGSLLRGALGCEVTVPMPLYAMTTSDQQFEEGLAASPSINACSIRQTHDDYWAQVQALQQRTKGFWLPEDVAELERLKAQRRQALAGFLAGQ